MRVATRRRRPRPTVTVVHNGDTKMRVHVAGATTPFWLVLGESQSPGWHAHVVDGGDLGPSQLVDGYANGWLVHAARVGSFDVVLEWTPQRQVWAAIWISLLGALAVPRRSSRSRGRRRRSVVTTAATPRPGDADVDLGWSHAAAELPRPPRPALARAADRGRVLGALVVAPWVGVLVAARASAACCAGARARGSS